MFDLGQVSQRNQYNLETTLLQCTKSIRYLVRKVIIKVVTVVKIPSSIKTVMHMRTAAQIRSLLRVCACEIEAISQSNRIC